MASRNVNLFVGKDQAWLEARLAEVQDEMASGSAFGGGQFGDLNFSNTREWSLQQRWNALIVALNKIDPTGYPLTDLQRPNVTIGKVNA